MNTGDNRPCTFVEALGGVVVHPFFTMKVLSVHPSGVKWGLYSVTLLGLLYTLTVAGLYGIGVGATVSPWLRIPAEEYYFWEIFMVFPVYFGVWVLGAGFVQLVSRPLGGSGSFEGTLATLGFAMTIPWYVTWVVETLGMILVMMDVITLAQWQDVAENHTVGKVFAIAYQLIAMVWLIVLMPIAVRSSQGLTAIPSFVVGMVTLIIVGIISFVFIR